MQDFEKLGQFYLGKAVDEESGELTDNLVLYDSKDLTTHAVIIGMTGSGKTGLGIGMIEEAALDNIPVIAIDPKGDLGNLLLTFPKLAAKSFEPWVNSSEAANDGVTVAEFAKAQAALWKKGLASWGQTGKRIATLRSRVDMAIYTPGSSAGRPVSVLDSFAAPARALVEDRDLYRERVQSTATSILALLGLDADPVTSREHILIANLLDHHWQEGRSLTLTSLIGEIQNPPMTKIGVMEVEQFYPPKDRFTLAMQLNNLLAAPGFEAWLEGETLDPAALFYGDKGKPRISVMSIAHLSDAERMFFVCMLLNELIAWMRAQPGTTSLRAILYMDEVFGYLPPVANPPSKQLFLTLLKQARAYGLGVVLSTQNPVDLDYKGLSNTGTWMIGRLQTERDKARVMEGLEGVAAGAEFDRGDMEATLAGLGKRRFLLHNVHENEPVVFNTRWVMSYLAGPLTREQIGRLEKAPARKKVAEPVAKKATAPATLVATRPVVPSEVRQFYLEAGADENIVYLPRVVGAADVAYSSARYKVETERTLIAAVEADDGPVAIDWGAATLLETGLDALAAGPVDDAEYGELPSALVTVRNYSKWTTGFKRWIRTERPVTLYRSKALKLTSGVDETESDFRIRLQIAASEQRDTAIAKLKKRYASKTRTLENRLLRAEQAIERESQQSTKKKLDVAVSIGSAILGAVLGRKRLSRTSASRIGTAVKTIGSARKESGDIDRARETRDKVRTDLDALNAELEKEIEALEDVYNSQDDDLDEIAVKAKSTDIEVHFVGLLWVPFQRNATGKLTPASID